MDMLVFRIMCSRKVPTSQLFQQAGAKALQLGPPKREANRRMGLVFVRGNHMSILDTGFSPRIVPCRKAPKSGGLSLGRWAVGPLGRWAVGPLGLGDGGVDVDLVLPLKL